jgi:type IV secretory pathway VirD2 relaxase
MARIVRHRSGRFRSAPLSKHVAYLKREGVTRDGADARMFDAASPTRRLSPNSAKRTGVISASQSLRRTRARWLTFAFTRELMKDAERDLGTRLDWAVVDHWNTDNPHVHVLVRGRADDGQDLVNQPRLSCPRGGTSHIEAGTA